MGHNPEEMFIWTVNWFKRIRFQRFSHAPCHGPSREAIRRGAPGRWFRWPACQFRATPPQGSRWVILVTFTCSRQVGAMPAAGHAHPVRDALLTSLLSFLDLLFLLLIIKPWDRKRKIKVGEGGKRVGEGDERGKDGGMFYFLLFCAYFSHSVLV